MNIIALEAASCGLCWLLFRRRFSIYQISILVIFLSALTLVGTLDSTLPVYFIAVCLPLIRGVDFKERFPLFFYAVCGIYLVIGILLQDVAGSFVTFITRLFQFMVFYLVYENRAKIALPRSHFGLIVFATAAETVLGIYLSINSTFVDNQTGALRLVSNAQPITGNLAVAVLPLLIWEYFHPDSRPSKRVTLIVMSLILFVWIILSGTRGYTVIFGLSVLVMYGDFFGIHFLRGKCTLSKRSVMAVLLITAGVIFLIYNEPVIEKVSSLLGLERSTGIRTYENAMSQEFFTHSSWPTKLFGIGIGGSGADYPAYIEALNRQSALGMWHYDTYYNATGTVFHNLYANILLTQGLLGVALTAAVFLDIFRKIRRGFWNSAPLKYSLLLYLAGFAIMNYFRWSAACGIPEMMTFAYVLRLKTQEKQDVSRFPVNSRRQGEML